MVIYKELQRCKQSIEEPTIEQINTLSYLGAEITSNKNLTKEVINQARKGSMSNSTMKRGTLKLKYIKHG